MALRWHHHVGLQRIRNSLMRWSRWPGRMLTYLERRSEGGVVAFWFEAQDPTDGSYPQGRAYAQTTRIEIGRALGWHDMDSGIVPIVGFHEKYTKRGGGSEGYLRKELGRSGIKVCSSLEELKERVILSLVGVG